MRIIVRRSYNSVVFIINKKRLSIPIGLKYRNDYFIPKWKEALEESIRELTNDYSSCRLVNIEKRAPRRGSAIFYTETEVYECEIDEQKLLSKTLAKIQEKYKYKRWLWKQQIEQKLKELLDS